MRVASMLLVCLMVLFVGCAEKGIVPNEAFAFRNSDEQRQFERRAVAGDVEAARRLTDYYFFLRNDTHKALYWAKIGASHGDKVSAQNVRAINQIIKQNG